MLISLLLVHCREEVAALVLMGALPRCVARLSAWENSHSLPAGLDIFQLYLYSCLDVREMTINLSRSKPPIHTHKERSFLFLK